MEFEFDKEMDALLRQAARGGEVISPTAAHLDADEISAFTENALPEKAKTLYTAHLADCTRCRKILSHLITLESEEAALVAVSAVVEEKAVGAGIPWYRKIFAMPNLAYTMGALALLFSGLIAFIALQNSKNMNSEISQVSEDSMTANRANTSAAAPMAANSNMMAMNANSSANSASVYSNTTTNSSAANVPLPSLTPNTFADAIPGESKNLPNPTPPADELSRERDKDLAKTDRSQGEDIPAARKTVEENKPANPIKQENKQAAETESRSDDNAVVTTAPKPNVAQPSSAASGATTTKDQKEKKIASKRSETTTSGGKTFRRANNVWYDTEYKNQATINVTRGTSAYKKLDSGLRSIAENLGGTVVIVWKSRAYRIQ